MLAEVRCATGSAAYTSAALRFEQPAGMAPMAQFKELTLSDGEKITINVDNVCAIQRFVDLTTISFSRDYAIHVKDAPGEILADPIDPRL